MREGIRKKLEEFEREEYKKLLDGKLAGAYNNPVSWTSYIISEKINILAELLEEKIESLKEERKQ